MISYPPGKINLGLLVTSRREDGYHNIETVFVPVPLSDILEINFSDKPSFTLTGIPLPGNENENLVQKAISLLRERYEIPPLNIHLHKQIPSGAGLGGGSSDAASALKMVNEICTLNLSDQELKEIALRVGSDCPFFLLDHPAAGRGRGEVLSPVYPVLSGVTLVLVFPGIHVSTEWAFGQIKPVPGTLTPDQVIVLPGTEWRSKLVNDFEFPVFKKYPLLSDIKQELYNQGAFLSMMSGSGSTMFALFENDPQDLRLPVDLPWQKFTF